MILVLLFISLTACAVLFTGGWLSKRASMETRDVVDALAPGLVITGLATAAIVAVFIIGFNSRYYIVDRLPQPTATAIAR